MKIVKEKSEFRIKKMRNGTFSIYDSHGELVDYGYKTRRSAEDYVKDHEKIYVTKKESVLSNTSKDIKKAMCEYMPEYCKDQSDEEDLDLKEDKKHKFTIKSIKDVLKFQFRYFMITNHKIGFDEEDFDNYCRFEVNKEDDGRIRVEVRAEIGYESLEELCNYLNKYVKTFDKEAYFEPVDAGIAECYIDLNSNVIEELDLKEDNYSDTYDRRDIVDYVIKYATDRDRYFNISCAYDSDVSTSDSEKTVERLISEFVDDNIIDELTGEYDYTDETYDLIQDNLDDLKHIDDYFKDYGKKQNSIWQSEKDELNREYRRSQGF